MLHILKEEREGNVFRMLPVPVLEVLCGELCEEKTFDISETIIENCEIAKYFFFVKKGGCMVEFTNHKLVYKEPMLAGQVFGFESLLTNIYHSKATANTMAEIVQVKKSLLLKIFVTFPEVEEVFWKNHIFQCYKMFHRTNEISFRISQLQKSQLEIQLTNFKLFCIEPRIIEDPSDDMIFIRGNIEVTTARDEKSIMSSPLFKKMSKESDPLISTESAAPFYFISKLTETTVRVKEPSIFLVGSLDYEVFELESMRLSRTTGWKGQRKKDRP